MKNKKIISKVIWGILIFTIILLLLCFFKQREENLVEEIPLNSFVEENVVETVGERKNNNVNISIEKNTSWVENDNHYSNYQIYIENLLSKNINNWKIVIHFNQKVNVSQYWNSQMEIFENDIIFEGLEYNSCINSGEEVSFGGIFMGKSEIEILSYEILSNDKSIIDNKIESAEERNSKDLKDFIEFDKESSIAFHGKLSVKDQNIVDQRGEKFLIQGISTHSIKDFSQYINYDSFKYLKEELNCNTIRLALYSDTYMENSKELHAKVDEGIKYATNLGLYVIIDWHILKDKDPNTNKESAKEFFVEIASKYKDYENILYEICNEPNGDVSWQDIKNYAMEMIPLIRDIDKDSIIIIGTPNFCQKIEDAEKNPIEEYDNLLYSLHFYSASHKEDLRKSLNAVYEKKFPVIVSEFGLSEASGNGSINEEEASIWIDFLREKNIGYICWNLSNKNESCAILKSDVESVSGWNDEDLTQVGLWIKNKYNN